MTCPNLYDTYVDRLEAGETVLPYEQDWPNSKPSAERKNRKAAKSVVAKVEATQTEQVAITDLPADFETYTTSAKSRYLVFDKELSVADTARYLKIRYQQVYQVVKKEELKRLEASK